MNKNKIFKYTLIQFIIIFSVIGFVVIGIISTKKTEPCIQYAEHIKELKKRIYEDSITIKMLGSDYYELWEENQVFSSMLSDMEGEPGGHEILKKLWDKNKNTQK